MEGEEGRRVRAYAVLGAKLRVQGSGHASATRSRVRGEVRAALLATRRGNLCERSLGHGEEQRGNSERGELHVRHKR